MILSSLMPPTTRTFTPGWSASKSFTASLKTLSSRWVKPTHSVMLAGSSLAGAFFAGVLASPEPPPPPEPPQPTTPADTISAVAAAIAIRFILSSSPSKEPFPDGDSSAPTGQESRADDRPPGKEPKLLGGGCDLGETARLVGVEAERERRVQRELLGADNVDQRRQRLQRPGPPGGDGEAEAGAARRVADRDQLRAGVAGPRRGLAHVLGDRAGGGIG